MNTGSVRFRGATFGIAAAALFGASAPLAKLLLPSMDPLALSGLLYVGAGLAVTLLRGARRADGDNEAPLRAADILPLAVVVATGGVVAPICLLYGLSAVSGVVGSLLLNLEAVFTILVAVLIFGEHLSRREAAGAVAIVAGSVVVAGAGGGEISASLAGTSAIAAACLTWGLDNNLSQRLSLRDPLVIVQWKGWVGGCLTLGLAFSLGQRFGNVGQVSAGLALGGLAYGLSLVLDLYTLRLLGAAREASIFATAPFIGALLSIPILGEAPAPSHAMSAALMLAGVALLIGARHSHAHVHGTIDHEHVHVHDEHHSHGHPTEVPGSHSHPHVHAPVEHDHPHVSDTHHRHPHSG